MRAVYGYALIRFWFLGPGFWVPDAEINIVAWTAIFDELKV
jgi:hypothetical protein